MNKKSCIIIMLILMLLHAVNVMAGRKGCCSHHGGVCGNKCCDGSEMSKICKAFYNKIEPTQPFTAILNRVIDGDTIDVLALPDYKYYRIRLYGVDAPELSQPMGETAKEHVNSILYNWYWFKVVPMGRGYYGRLLGKVYKYENDSCVDSLQHMLVRNGYAFVYPVCKDEKFCNCLNKAETEAKKEKIGVWKYNIIYPWLYRKQK